MDNPTACNAYSNIDYKDSFLCLGNTGPYNVSDAQAGYFNQTGQAVWDAMKACCPSPIELWGPDEVNRCYHYCDIKTSEQAWETEYCFGNYSEAHPDQFFADLKCGTDNKSGATMLGRTSGWGGLALLGLVVSVAAGTL
ncbi:hypothetical protein V493_00429 [Pseudogymnoascus sp. VKM F-4281 (FW-2241)]|nr:hypothetical protein V493_00429 [Pseudogymnoascus sp. VKM F-4281 (FW-2241)]